MSRYAEPNMSRAVFTGALEVALLVGTNALFRGLNLVQDQPLPPTPEAFLPG